MYENGIKSFDTYPKDNESSKSSDQKILANQHWNNKKYRASHTFRSMFWTPKIKKWNPHAPKQQIE